MLRPSKKLSLALEAVVDIAAHGTVEPVQSQAVANRLELPRRYLEQVMQHLVKAGVLKGVRGPKGGYRLARERRRITVAEIVDVVQNLDDKTEATLGSNSPIGQSVMVPFWERHEKDMIARLREVTIEDLCKQADKVSAISNNRAEEMLDYII